MPQLSAHAAPQMPRDAANTATVRAEVSRDGPVVLVDLLGPSHDLRSIISRVQHDTMIKHVVVEWKGQEIARYLIKVPKDVLQQRGVRRHRAMFFEAARMCSVGADFTPETLKFATYRFGA